MYVSSAKISNFEVQFVYRLDRNSLISLSLMYANERQFRLFAKKIFEEKTQQNDYQRKLHSQLDEMA